MKPRLCIIALAAFPSLMAAQSQPRFEVATIKLAKNSMGGVWSGCHGIDSVYAPAQSAEAPPLGRCIITDGRLSHMVGIAWNVTMPMLKSGPDWIQRGDVRYNLEAKAEDPGHTTEKQLLAMLQALLIERFQLKYHLEPAELSGFGLTVAKGGPKFHESQSTDSSMSFGPEGKPNKGHGIMNAHRCSMRQFVDMLSLFGNHGPGVDHTGLTGLYDFKLTWDEEAGPTIVDALREQMSLVLKGEKVAVSYFVIDSAQRPSEN